VKKVKTKVGHSADIMRDLRHPVDAKVRKCREDQERSMKSDVPKYVRFTMDFGTSTNFENP